MHSTPVHFYTNLQRGYKIQKYNHSLWNCINHGLRSIATSPPLRVRYVTKIEIVNNMAEHISLHIGLE